MGQGTAPALTPQSNSSSLRNGSHPGLLYEDRWEASAIETMRLFTIQLLCAGGSGAIAKTAVAPLERVKILLQVQSLSSVPQPQQYKGLMDALRRIPLQDGGWTALYRGNGANVLRLVPEVGFKFVVHDQFKIMFAPADGSPLGVAEKLAAGAATALLKSLLFHPLDLARVRITADASGRGEPRTYPTIRACLSKTWQQEGIRGLYRGLMLSSIGIVPYLSLSLTAYDQLKQQLPEGRASHGSWWFPFLKMGCGATAAAGAQTVLYPLDTLRRRLQVSGGQGQSESFRSALVCLQDVLARDGVRGLYRGCLVNVLKTTPGAAVQFVAYDLIKTSISIVDPTAGVQSPL